MTEENLTTTTLTVGKNKENQQKHRHLDQDQGVSSVCGLAVILVQNLSGGGDRENRQGKDFGSFQGYLKGIWGNPSLAKTHRKITKRIREMKEKPMKNKEIRMFYSFFHSFLCLHPSEGVPGVDLDMPDSILTSLDLRNHRKHPNQRKTYPK